MALSSTNRWKQWWKISSNSCYSKKILLLLGWVVLFNFSVTIQFSRTEVVSSSTFLNIISFFCITSAPFVGWLADVRFGRHKVIKFGSLILFLSSTLWYFQLFIGEGLTVTNIIYPFVVAVQGIGTACFVASMLPFLTDQLIGATSDELSVVVQWYIWSKFLGTGLSEAVSYLVIFPNYQLITVTGMVSIIFAVPLAVIIISDCFCQQWLDKTHKITNPIKLIILVLNYTRKHRYPERRSAFTYIDEEQPTRMDYGKEKFGGPFTEEEVEDAKTVLRLIPLVICSSVFIVAEMPPAYFLSYMYDLNLEAFINSGMDSWLIPVLLIPVYQFLLHRFIHRYTPSILNSLAIGMALYLVGYIALVALIIKEVVVFNNVQSYFSCARDTSLPFPEDYVEWYWKLGPYVLCGIGYTITTVLQYELIIAQSPDKMKGFVLGVMLASSGMSTLPASSLWNLIPKFCSNLSLFVLLFVMFVIFAILSKRYTLRERNREINIQAIVEEHYERYMDQEEEYMREQRYSRDNFLN